MSIKIENQITIRPPKNTILWVENIMRSLPREHLRGLEKIRLVDNINDPRVKTLSQRTELPGLYHPRQGGQQAWMEIALGVLLPQGMPFLKRLTPRLSFKGNMAATIFSLVGQHYYLTLKHSVKKSQLESSVRSYAEKQLKNWHQNQHSLRSRLFKPFQPTFEKWGKALQKKVMAEQKKRQAT